MRKLQILGTLAIAGTLLVSCTATTPAAAPAAPATAAARVDTVNANLTDAMKVTVDRNTITAGKVSFVVKNSGLIAHELVLLRTDVSQEKLAVSTEEPGKMVETGNVGETGDMDAGASKTFSATLPAGHYILMCNEVGHYASGMHIAFTVN